MKSTLALIGVLATCLLLSACGQTGPLYMPKTQTKAGATTPGKPGVAPASSPVPATPPVSQQQ
ncbi:lipoprotein [Massilia sp. MB5]|uniref:LPS translocon maturation chaperone LptM n=1 Tax=unclassified Massilia TaxID=2609279 RepID=UPI000AAE7AB5|nr:MULTISPECIES: lipoprotein [unclassified Massilia]UMR32351.1 lipoprotein [Massilia sp. MB5]